VVLRPGQAGQAARCRAVLDLPRREGSGGRRSWWRVAAYARTGVTGARPVSIGRRSPFQPVDPRLAVVLGQRQPADVLERVVALPGHSERGGERLAHLDHPWLRHRLDARRGSSRRRRSASLMPRGVSAAVTMTRTGRVNLACRTGSELAVEPCAYRAGSRCQVTAAAGRATQPDPARRQQAFWLRRGESPCTG